MSIRRTVLVPGTTALSYSSPFTVYGCATITSGDLADNEGVQVQYSNDGTDWHPLYLNGVLQEIDADHSIITVAGPGKFRVLKSATIEAVSVNMWETELL